MEYLKRVSMIIYLKNSLEIIKERITDVPRGIVGLKNMTLEELYKEKTMLYQQYALIIIDGEQAAEEVARNIMAHIPNLKS